MLFALLVSSVASNLIGTLHPSHLSQYKNKLTTAAGLADIYYLTQFDTGKWSFASFDLMWTLDLDVNWESACLLFKDFSTTSNVNDLFYASEYLRTKTGKKCTIQLGANDFALATKALDDPENLRVAYQAIVIEIVSKINHLKWKMIKSFLMKSSRHVELTWQQREMIWFQKWLNW